MPPFLPDSRHLPFAPAFAIPWRRVRAVWVREVRVIIGNPEDLLLFEAWAGSVRWRGIPKG